MGRFAFDICTCSIKTLQAQRVKVIFLMPGMYTPKKPFIEPRLILGSKGCMDVQYAIYAFKINFGTGPPKQKSTGTEGGAKYFPVLLRTKKGMQGTSQNSFVLQSLHAVLPSTKTYYKSCTKYSSVLLRATKLAQGSLQYYFVPQSLRKVLPSTTSYFTGWQSTSQYFVLQRLCRSLPTTICSAKVAQSRCFQYYFVLESFAQNTSRAALHYDKDRTTNPPAFLCTTRLAHTAIFPGTTLYCKRSTKLPLKYKPIAGFQSLKSWLFTPGQKNNTKSRTWGVLFSCVANHSTDNPVPTRRPEPAICLYLLRDWSLPRKTALLQQPFQSRHLPHQKCSAAPSPYKTLAGRAHRW